MASIAAVVLLALALLLGFGVLVQNHCPGQGAWLSGGRAAAGAGAAAVVQPKRSCAHQVMSAVAVLSMINAVISLVGE